MVGITIPLVLAITFVTMYYWGVGLHKISLGSLIIALGLLVDDAIIAVEMMVRKLEEGYDKARAATFAYEATAMPMLTGTLITAVGFPADRPGQVDGRRVHLRDLRGDGRGAADLLAGLGLFRALPRHAAAPAKRACRWRRPQPHELFDTPFYSRFRALVNWCVQHRWITIGADLGIAGPGSGWAWARCRTSSSPIRAASRCWSTSGFRKAPRSPPTRKSPSASRRGS